MSAPEVSADKTTRVVRWIARAWGSLLALMVLVFTAGEGLPSPARLTAPERLMFVALAIMVFGLIAAWKWEGFGGVLILIGYGLFAVADRRVLVRGLFSLFPIAGLLFLFCWWRSRESAP
jgi:hypothetical protein